MKQVSALLATFVLTVTAAGVTAPPSVLFIGNSFLFGSGSAVRFYRADTVTDLNHEGIGGVPALFKSFARQAGLDYDVSLETRGGSGLDFHLGNKLTEIGSGTWDTVVMHGFSLLDAEKPRDPAKLIATSKQMADFLRGKNPNVNIFLISTWPRADHVYPEKGAWHGQSNRSDDARRPCRLRSGREERRHQDGDSGGRVVAAGHAGRDCRREPYDGIEAGKLNLWTYDSYHASTHGYYLQALMIFGTLTGKDPRSLGDSECSAFELGMSRAEVKSLQQVAFDQLGAAVTAAPKVSAKPAPAQRCAAAK